MQETILEVKGMTCKHCEKAVINALSHLGVKASVKKGNVKVVFSPETISLVIIKNEIKELGYHV